MCKFRSLPTLFLLSILILLSFNFQMITIADRSREFNRNFCNEYLCASIVSKCILIQSCQCELTNMTCLQECFFCLGDLFTACCGCLKMCEKFIHPLDVQMPKSEYGILEGLPELFETLSEEDDNWTVMRLAMRSSLQRHYGAGFGVRKSPASSSSSASAPLLYCTVIYLNGCRKYHKCAQDCENMGANGYRWFHDGCCECVGANCLNYGIDESHCAACPKPEEKEDDEEDYDDESTWTYGEEDGFIID